MRLVNRITPRQKNLKRSSYPVPGLQAGEDLQHPGQYIVDFKKRYA